MTYFAHVCEMTPFTISINAINTTKTIGGKNYGYNQG